MLPSAASETLSCIALLATRTAVIVTGSPSAWATAFDLGVFSCVRLGRVRSPSLSKEKKKKKANAKKQTAKKQTHQSP